MISTNIATKGMLILILIIILIPILIHTNTSYRGREGRREVRGRVWEKTY